MRWDGLEDAYLDPSLYPSAYIAKFEELKSILPSDEKIISKNERINQIEKERGTYKKDLIIKKSNYFKDFHLHR